jgi:hypothetical protein
LLIDTRNVAPLTVTAKVSDPKLKIEQGKRNILPQKLTDSGTRPIPKVEQMPNRKVSRQAATKKVTCALLDWC